MVVEFTRSFGMNKFDAISIVQMTLIMMTAIGLKVHVLIISFLMQSSGRDAWITVLLAALAVLIWGLLLLYIHNKTEAGNIFDWIESNIGKIPRFIFSNLLWFYLVFMAAFTLRETLVWTETTYLPETPRWITVPVVLLLCFFLANTSLQTMAMTNIIVLTAVLVLGHFVGFSNYQFKDFSMLKPILEHGFGPVFSGLIFSFSGMVELLLLIFMQHKIYDRIKFKHIVVNVALLSWLTLGPLIGSITEFGPTEASRQTYPAYEQWAIVSIGRFIEHLDFFSIYQWLSGNFIRVSFLLFAALETLKYKSKTGRKWVLVLFCLLTASYQFIPLNNPNYYQIEKNIIIPFTFWMFFSISLFLGGMAMIFGKKTKGN
jgi:spore germination protein (amino acid permease)